MLRLSILVLVLAGCGFEDRPSEAVATRSPGLLPGDSGSDECIEIVVSSSAAPPEHVIEMATEVVLGRFAGYGPARWNTPDGHRPIKGELQRGSPRLARALSITPIEHIVGNGSSLDRAVEGGGVLGCDRVSYEPVIPLQPGATYLFFLRPVSNSQGVLAGDLSLLMAWPVADDGTVSTTHLGDLSLSAARDVICVPGRNICQVRRPDAT